MPSPESDHPDEHLRDIPASCICEWRWHPPMTCYLLWQVTGGCPWHTETKGA
jgi:hypothetical protein